MNISFITAMIIIGAITGMVTGITGASGVMIFVPLVSMVLKFSIHEAIGTSLMVNVISSLAITYIYYKHGNINLKSGIWIAIGSII
ncbi:MAG TPA: sulfite exporter TauE/SafE family protein, partial [Spirochaetota bacterium]|nr:sulfite exporter TauE/SafE family protein [Spirochaetota bacterium]